MTSALSCIICHDCDKSLRYFHVPSNPERLLTWCNLLNLDIDPTSIVCEKHFLEEHISLNRELNCRRLNKKAIPTLHLTDDQTGDVKLIKEEDFDKHESINQNACAPKDCKTRGTQTNKSLEASLITCLWCSSSFSEPDLYDILMHLKNKHHYEIESFIEYTEDEISVSNMANHDDEVDENEQDLQANVLTEESCDIDEIEIESNSLKSEHYDEGQYYDDSEDEMDGNYQIEEYNIKNEPYIDFDSNDEKEQDGNMDDVLQVKASKPGSVTINKMLQTGEISNNQINMEESDSNLIFFIIDLLRSIPTLWFINCYKSKEYEAGFTELCTQFSETYQYFMNQTELHESLIEIRDWYMKIYDAGTSDQLPCPQSKYFEKLAEFLPDKTDGKTCELCGVLFNDHIQYFGHKKLEHAMSEDDIGDVTALSYLKTKSYAYFYARYPLFQLLPSSQCQNCPKKGSNKNKISFYEHIKTHLDVRDHICDVCGKSFVKYKLFQVHKNRHFGLHKFPCKICGKEFTNGSLLTAHRKRYHRPILGTNEQIELKIKHAARRGSHIVSERFVHVVRDGNEVFACRFCDKTYKYRAGAFKHCRIAHPDLKFKKREYKNKN